MVGSNAFDTLAVLGAGPQPATPQAFVDLVDKVVNMTAAAAQAIADQYIAPPSKYGNVTQGWWKLTADLCVICPSAALADLFPAAKQAPTTWQYDFDGPRGLAPHTGELPYVFGPDSLPSFCGPGMGKADACRSPYNATLGADVMAAWRAFAWGQSPGWPDRAPGAGRKAYRTLGDGGEATVPGDLRGAECAVLAANLNPAQWSMLCGFGTGAPIPPV